MSWLKLDKLQTPQEEWANTLTHFLGVLAACLGLTFLVIRSFDKSGTTLFASGLFGLSMVIMFAASMCYHYATRPNLKKRLKIFDHCAIFFLIAGTYTPFLLIALHNTFSYTLLITIWLIAIIGTIYKLFFVYHFPKLSTLFYLAMGWLSVIAIKPLHAVLASSGLDWLFYGGLCYTSGVVFYAWKKLLYSHAIWHLFVIAGCACHFVAIFSYVLPRAC